MYKNKKRFLTLLILAAISGSTAFTAISVSADEVTAAEEQPFDNSGEETQPSEEAPADEDEEQDLDGIAHEEEDDDSLTADEKASEMSSYKEKTLTITNSKFVADTYKGVQALYRPGKNDGTDATYSCAAYIKRFYKKVYGVSVHNLFGGSTPRTYEGTTFKKVTAPKTGDIVSNGSHWSIVKKVDKTSKKVVLIEQNWKWSQGGQTVCKVNRTVSYSGLSIYRLNNE